MDKPAVPFSEKARLEELRALEILDTPNDPALDRITRLVQQFFSVPICLISLVDEHRQWFKSCIGVSVKQTPRDISFCAHAILDNGPLVVCDALLDPRFADNPLVTGEPNIRFYAGSPITLQSGNRIGTLCIIDHQPRSFTQEQANVLKDFTAIIERELAVMQLATTDELTLLPNRRSFSSTAERYLDLCIRQNLKAKLVFIDLDNFKPINDTFGHATGDEVLKGFANVLASCCRKADLFARLSGDEFVILFTDLSTQECEVIMQRLAESFSELSGQFKHKFNLSFSHGIANFSGQKPCSLSHLLALADSRMYKTKVIKKNLLIPTESNV
ncbi:MULTISPECIES: sensor domain-containing diguanylate cyclase [Pseudoalteromonas]|jgi:diguanylate cyclase (GGDEF)-like protein|uniref:Sensor domain-containing diguanylate cyclase n=1 Tax=Pseudoalteromonas lipolytica TaxID=570156 RepID=A0AAD0WE27_9GAMM|nr:MULTISPECIES: sensor domain-containing diguanylate cyclase [Pseudoalteromonas]AXV67030.1 sensor domain-containing diguanylate cyclase [Pseudoalteromonas donghaensis]EWH05152.1 diguanylate cyclase [Pseudoalteromonas lipolytica SCSIO 04301]MCC9661960.1 sensor domain-containing diguanylate cyclase [Pseudoalteromonas sp. MB41]QLJ10562.1 sensor domain-containing diguanylate cyclase [Pseudoalteromonas sp. JSTW]QMW16411.1 sensor domain-containing diguanylate cyclase [Pseudoalteromonas sp. MT33b]|tara:strand:+ start:583 stop:1572 length:990 start_codon:yes stop_codon:yes gene_type:complete